MTPDEAIKYVRSQKCNRELLEPDDCYYDEVLVEEIERLRKQLAGAVNMQDHYLTAGCRIANDALRYGRIIDRLCRWVLRLRKRLSDAEATLSLVEAICPPDTGSDWWCPKCKEVLSGSHVTFTEHCDTCGTYLGDCQPDDKWQALRERLAVVRAARERNDAT